MPRLIVDAEHVIDGNTPYSNRLYVSLSHRPSGSVVVLAYSENWDLIRFETYFQGPDWVVIEADDWNKRHYVRAWVPLSCGAWSDDAVTTISWNAKYGGFDDAAPVTTAVTLGDPPHGLC